MNNYNDFLFEKNIFREGYKTISKNTFIDLYKENCKEFDISNAPIYRTILRNEENYNIEKMPSFFIVDNDRYERKSMEGTNYYTLLFNNLPSWNKFPKRKLICSLNEMWSYYTSVKKQYYRVIPFDGSKWGVVPAHDIWACSIYKYGSSSVSFQQFNRVFNKYDICDDNWECFVKDINEPLTNKSDFGIYDNMPEKIYWSMRYISVPENVKELYDDIPFDKDNFIGYLDKIFSPKKLNFKCVNYKNLKTIKENREVWTDDKCLLVRNDVFEKMYPSKK